MQLRTESSPHRLFMIKTIYARGSAVATVPLVIGAKFIEKFADLQRIGKIANDYRQKNGVHYLISVI